mmetsp:Transcript_43511/g.78203  ORF Transcript_43511/g.78203 Transcript_43511/m.78203 type:complete len:91 (+) Transcript_43511:305-577(+)
MAPGKYIHCCTFLAVSSDDLNYVLVTGSCGPYCSCILPSQCVPQIYPLIPEDTEKHVSYVRRTAWICYLSLTTKSCVLAICFIVPFAAAV